MLSVASLRHIKSKSNSVFDILASNETAAGDGGTAPENFWDALVWLIPATSAAMLSLALHRTDHHASRDPESLADRHEAMWNAEHFGAWLTAMVFSVLNAAVLAVRIREENRALRELADVS